MEQLNLDKTSAENEMGYFYQSFDQLTSVANEEEGLLSGISEKKKKRKNVVNLMSVKRLIS